MTHNATLPEVEAINPNFPPLAFTLLTKKISAVHAEIEHLLNESSIRNPGYFVFANVSMLL